MRKVTAPASRNGSFSRRLSERNVESCLQTFLIVMIAVTSVGIWKSALILEEHLQNEQRQIPQERFSNTNTQQMSVGDPTAPQPALPNNSTTTYINGTAASLKAFLSRHDGPRYLVYAGVSNGQGAGNILHGMLSAFLLALEFNRTPCLKWDEFLTVFEYTDPKRKEICKEVIEMEPDKTITMWNFQSSSVDECVLSEKLQNRRNKVVRMKGNTYPGWRSNIPDNFFFKNFRARQKLLDFLPYDYRHPPETVVHFRSPDAKADSNRGLDPESLRTIGKLLYGNGTYLVTNRPDWYQRFNKCCGWSYDHTWNEPIRHWAINLEWRLDGSKSREEEDDVDGFTKPEQTLKLYSDWYTMVTAKRVYHSNSDFSGSAVHWNPDCTGYELHGMKNETINGTVNRVLNLLPAGYDDPKLHIPPLVERQRPDSFHNDDNCVFLRFCHMFKNTTNGHAKVDRLVKKLKLKSLGNPHVPKT